MGVQLDRFGDNGFAVLLPYPGGKQSFDVPRQILPQDAAPGAVFTASFERDPGESERVGRENWRLMDELMDRGES